MILNKISKAIRYMDITGEEDYCEILWYTYYI